MSQRIFKYQFGISEKSSIRFRGQIHDPSGAVGFADTLDPTRKKLNLSDRARTKYGPDRNRTKTGQEIPVSFRIFVFIYLCFNYLALVESVYLFDVEFRVK